MKFNTAISRMMEFINHFSNHENITEETRLNLIKMIAPFTPHIAEELWHISGGECSVFLESFPEYDPDLAEEDSMTIAVQVIGKLRGNIQVAKTITKEDLILAARGQDNVTLHLKDKDIIKEIVVPDRLVNFVIK